METGEGDDALTIYVERAGRAGADRATWHPDVLQPGGLLLVGRVIEKIVGTTYEKAMASLVFEPVGLTNTFFTAEDVMTRRSAVGHNRNVEDGTLAVSPVDGPTLP